MCSRRIPSVRISPDNETVLQQLGLIADLAGNWHGEGFNLVARPFFGLPATPPPDASPAVPPSNLFLELNLTQETLKFDPISSSIPNRGTFQEDLELFGLTYLQKISDATTGGALHIEPGIWVTHAPTTQPVENPPNNGQIVARMGSIPHGNVILAGGTPVKFCGPPTPVLPRSQAHQPFQYSRHSTPAQSRYPHLLQPRRFEPPDLRNCFPCREVVSRSTH